MNASPLYSIPAALLLLKVTIVLSLGAVVTALLRGRSAASRHLAWLVTLLAVLALAPLSVLAPRLVLPLPASAVHAVPALVVAAPARLPAVDRAPASRTSVEAAGRSRVPVPSDTRPAPLAGLGLLWTAGALGVLLWSAFGHLGLWALLRSALPVERSAWARLYGLAPLEHGAGARVRLAHSSVVGTPLTWGWIRPVVLLPSRSSAWPLERRRVALLHELAHVERGDYVAQLAATLVCAVYWFHPLAWWAAGRLRSESEHACDDRVLAAGTTAPAYASDLLAVAQGARGPSGSRLVAIGMARRSHLEGRLLAVLDESRRRGTVGARTGLAALAGALLLIVPYAGLEPRAEAAQASTVETTRTVANTNTSVTVSTQTGTSVNIALTSAKDDAEETRDHHDVDDTLPAKPGGQLVLDLDTGGSVEIRGWDRNEVHVHARLAGADWRTTQLAIGPESFGVGVRAVPTGHGHSQSTSHSFEIQVPKRYDVKLSSAGGSISIADVEGTLEGNTGGGGIQLEHASGRASLVTGGGDIEVSDCDLDGSVSTGGGTVKLSRVKGGLRGSSGSGPVIYAEAAGGGDEGTGDLTSIRVDGSRGHIDLGTNAIGRLHIDRAGGRVDLDEVPNGAEIRTGGGEIRIRKGAGAIDAQTGGGDITIGPIAGSVSASTGAGDVSLRLASIAGRSQDVEVGSGTGNVIVELPADLNARFEIETAYTESFGRATKITSSWTLARKPVTDWDDSQGTPRRFVRASGKAGRGEGLIRIQTVNGDIELRKAGTSTSR